MTVSKMPLRSSGKWPKHYGFDIFGDGPSFVLIVARGSVAYNSGLLPGDQILRLDGQDVSVSSAKVLKSIANHAPSQPPTLGVVSRLRTVDLVCFPDNAGCGFTVHGNKPVRVSKVDPDGAASRAGIQPGTAK